MCSSDLVAAAGALLVGKLGIAAFILWQGHLAMTHYLREATAGQYASAAQELRAAVANGTAWTGQLPTPWNVDTFWLLPPLHRVFAVFAFGLGAALVFFVFATVARARSAHGAVPRWQHTLAGFLVWLPVFLLVSTPLMMLAEHYARASDGVVPVLVAALMLAGAGLLVRALHAAGAARGVVAVRPFGAVRQVALVVAALAMAAAAFCTVRIVWSAQSVRSLEPIHLRALAGQSQQQVVLSLGPPIAIEGEGDAMRWTYAGVDGKGHAVAFRDGEVRMTEDLDVQLVPIELPANGPFLGQPARELLRQLGPKVAVERQVDGSSLIRLPDGGTVRLREGLVVGVK